MTDDDLDAGADSEDSDLSARGGSKFRKRPPKTGYRVSGVPKRYVDQVQLSAVLRAIYGRLKTDPDIIDATAWALHHWRRRVMELAEMGWRSLGTTKKKKMRLPNAMMCPVAFVLIYGGKGNRKPCKFRHFCPFCWAREVRRYWLKIDAAFFPKPVQKRRVRQVDTGSEPERSSSFTRSVKDVEAGAKSRFDLVRRVFTFRVPKVYLVPCYGRQIPVDGLSAWLDSRIRGKPDPRLHRAKEAAGLLKAAGPGSGMIETISYCRVDYGDHPWEVQVHQLILARDGTKVPKVLHPMATAKPRCQIIYPKPGRRTIVQAVARALRYPGGLIAPQTPIEAVVEYLDVRFNRRLVASYGCFRDKKV